MSVINYSERCRARIDYNTDVCVVRDVCVNQIGSNQMDDSRCANLEIRR